jgi:AraC-like DNA-binding protein
MSSDAASIAWYLHRCAPESLRAAVPWPDGAAEAAPPDYPSRVPTEELARLLERLERDGAGSLACRAGVDASERPLTPLSLLLRSSDRVEELADRATRYWNAFSSSTRLESRVEADRWEMVVVESWRDRPRGLQLFTHYIVGALTGAVNGYTHGSVAPTEVLLPGTGGPEDAHLSKLLGAPVRRGSDLARVVYPRSALEAPLETRDELDATYLETELRRCLDRLKLAVTWQIDELIRARLDDGVGMRDAAKRLGLSERTLRRRLDEEGTSFRERLDLVRKDRALEMLAHTDIAEVAQTLGFVDARSFQRAFRRWTQLTPVEYRRRLESA